MTTPPTEPSPDDARHALVLHERQAVVDLVELTLNHGLFSVRAARDLAEAERIMAGWHAHLATSSTWRTRTARPC